MAKKICTAGVVGSFSFVVLEDAGTVVSLIRDQVSEIITQHSDVDFAARWTERKLNELIGKQYEAD